MILKMFTVYDSKVEAYLSPFFMRSTGEAIRAFIESCNDPKTKFWAHPSDYTLFCIGSFDDLNCLLNPTATPESLGCAIEYKKDIPLPLNHPELPHVEQPVNGDDINA